LKQSIEAKNRWTRKTFGQKVVPRPEDVEKLSRVNAILVKLWNMAIEQCNTWLNMSKSIIYPGTENSLRLLGFPIEMNNPERKSITPISLNFWLTPQRKNDADINSVSIVLAREMLRRLAGGFGSYFELKKKGDASARPPQQKNPDASFITLTWTQGSFSINDGILSATIGGRQRVIFTLGEYIQCKLKELPSEAFVAQVTVSMRDGEYWANFVCNIPKTEASKPKGVLAIDLGPGNIAISTSTGKEYLIHARRPDKRWRKEIFSVEARVAQCTKGSRAFRRRMKARRIMHNKSLRQHTDHQRKVAHWIIQQGMTVVVGKMRTRLGLAQSSGTSDQHWGVQNTGYAFRLLIFIKEKATEHGLSVIELPDPRRKGDKCDPCSKLKASRELLKQGCEKLKLSHLFDLIGSFKRQEITKTW
jgi:hypothetical protein